MKYIVYTVFTQVRHISLSATTSILVTV